MRGSASAPAPPALRQRLGDEADRARPGALQDDHGLHDPSIRHGAVSLDQHLGLGAALQRRARAGCHRRIIEWLLWLRAYIQVQPAGTVD